MTKQFFLDLLIGIFIDFQISIISRFIFVSMEQAKSWVNIIKLGKSEVIRQLQSRGIAIQGKFQYWQLCSSLYQVEQAERFELIMSECDLAFQEAETVLANAQKQIDKLKRD